MNHTAALAILLIILTVPSASAQSAPPATKSGPDVSRAPASAGLQFGGASLTPASTEGAPASASQKPAGSLRMPDGTSRTTDGSSPTADGSRPASDLNTVPVPDAPPPPPGRPKGNIDWAGLLSEQLRADGLMHMYRLSRGKTRAELHTSSYFGDYPDAIRGYFTTGFRWSDGDSAATNNISHLIMGAAYSHVYTNHDRRCSGVGYGEAGYWPCFRRAAIYSAVATVSWEWNPLLSEATLGHVGRHHVCVMGRCTGEGGWTDFVMTPLGGLGFRLAGDVARKKLWPILDRRLSGSLGARILNVTAKAVTDPGRMANAVVNLHFRAALSTPASGQR